MGLKKDDGVRPVRFQMATIVTTLTIVGALSVIIPLILQIRRKNYPAMFLIAGLLTSLAIFAINACIWSKTDRSLWWDGKLLCDIEVRVEAAVQMMKGGAIVCIYRDLWYAVNPSLRLRSSCEEQQRRSTYFLLFWCVALPILRSLLLYIVQAARYYVIAVHGCAVVVDASWPAWALYITWPAIPAISTMYYNGLIFHYAAKHLREISSIFGKTPGRTCDPELRRLYSFSFWLALSYASLFALTPMILNQTTMTPFSWSRIHPQDFWTRPIEMRAIYGVNFIYSVAGDLSLSTIVCLWLTFHADARALGRECLDAINPKKRWTQRQQRKRAQRTGRSGIDDGKYLSPSTLSCPMLRAPPSSLDQSLIHELPLNSPTNMVAELDGGFEKFRMTRYAAQARKNEDIAELA